MPIITYNSAAMTSKISEIESVENSFNLSKEDINGYINIIRENSAKSAKK